MRTPILSMILIACLALTPLAQKKRSADLRAKAEALMATAPQAKLLDPIVAAQTGCDVIVKLQEGGRKKGSGSEWPYEGVYRVRGKGGAIIPIGYRVGGTAICGMALLEAPGLKENKSRRAALNRATAFVLQGLKEPLMASGFKGGYDVRGWGHTYALLFLLRMETEKTFPSKLRIRAKASVRWLIKTLEETAIPESGGWNYSRRAGFGNSRNSASPFMTAPTLQALFSAKHQGYKVSSSVVNEAIVALQRARTASGGYTYSAPGTAKKGDENSLSFMDKLPGSIARMNAVEATLALTSQGDQGRLRVAIDSFFKHWVELEVRRRQSNTHIQPYGVAPYYVMYGHYYVAQAIERLSDDSLKQGYRDRLNRLLAVIRETDGGWNDRVFDRSKNYGTAMAIMALRMKNIPSPAVWTDSKL